MAAVLGKWAAAAIGGAALVIARPFAVAPQHLFPLATAHAAIAQAAVEMPETLGVKSRRRHVIKSPDLITCF